MRKTQINLLYLTMALILASTAFATSGYDANRTNSQYANTLRSSPSSTYDYLQTNVPHFAQTDNFTFVAWVNISNTTYSATQTDYGLVCEQQAECLFVEANYTMFGVRNATGNNIASQGTINRGAIEMWTGVFNGTHTLLYQNATLVDSDSFNIQTIRDDSSSLRIGGSILRNTLNVTFRNSTIYKVVIYNRSLSASEISAEYNRTYRIASVNDSKLIAQYLFRKEPIYSNSTTVYDYQAASFGSLYLVEDFKNASVQYGSSLGGWSGNQTCTNLNTCDNHALTIFGGESGSDCFAARFERRIEDPIAAGGMRSELYWEKNLPANKTMTYGFQVNVNNTLSGSDWTYVWQAHQEEDACDGHIVPPLGITMTGSHWELAVRNASAACTATSSDVTSNYYNLGTITPKTTYNISLEYNYNYGADGFVIVLINNKVVAHVNGFVGYNDGQGPYLKTGSYSNNQSIITWIDSIKIGNENTTIETVNPANYYTGCLIDNVTVDETRQIKNISLMYSVQEKDRNALFLTNNQIRQNIIDTSSPDAYFRIWIAKNYTTSQVNTIPLLSDCTSYNYAPLLNYTQSVLNMGLKPHFTIAYAPDCMSNGTTSSNNDMFMPRNLDEFANYSTNIYSYMYGACANGTLTSCGDFSSWNWEIWNEAHNNNAVHPGFRWDGNVTQTGTWGNYTRVYNQTAYRLRSKAITFGTTVRIGSAGSIVENPFPTYYIKNLFVGVPAWLYPDFFGVHSYQNNYDTWSTYQNNPSGWLTGGNCNVASSIVHGTDCVYYDLLNAKYNVLQQYNVTELYNFEYNLDYSYDSTGFGGTPWITNPWIDNEIGATWLATALNYMTLSNLSAESFFEGTDVGQPHYGLWNSSGALKRIGLVKKQWVQRFGIGEPILNFTTQTENISILPTQEEAAVIHKRNGTDAYRRVVITFSNTSRTTLYGSDGNTYTGTSGVFSLGMRPLETIFLDYGATSVSISDLASPVQGTTWIYINWTNPTESDFSYVKIYREGVNIANTTHNYYNDTGLTLGFTYNYAVTPMATGDVAGTSDTLSQATLTNNAPTVVAWINPSYAEKNSTLIGLFNGSDQDVDNLSYEGYWAVNGVTISSFSNFSLNTSDCFQESATVATACGGLATGTYTVDSNWVNSANTYDGDYSTYGTAQSGKTATVIVNYSKPTYAVTANMWILHVGTVSVPFTANYSVPMSDRCFNAFNNSVQVKYSSSRGSHYNIVGYCYNGSSYEVLFSQSSSSDYQVSNFYEEAIVWGISQPPTYFTNYNPANFSGSFNAGDNVSFAVRLHDGTDYSSYSIASTIINSRPPSMVNVSINPTTAYSNIDLVCYANATDPDGDDLDYEVQWYLNGVANALNYKYSQTSGVYNNVGNVTADIINAGDNWTCSVRAYDGYNYTSWMNTSVTISPDFISTPLINNPSANGTTVINDINITWDLVNSIGIILHNYTVNLLYSNYTYLRTLSLGQYDNSYYLDLYNQGVVAGDYVIQVIANDTEEGLSSADYKTVTFRIVGGLNVSAVRLTTNETISSFNLTVTQGGLVYNYTTTDGFEFLNLNRNQTYNFTLWSSGYYSSNVTNYYVYSVNTSLVFNLSVIGTFNFTLRFLDERTQDLVNQNVYVDFISGYYSRNYTAANGTVSVSSLEPATYTIRYYSSGYTLRFHTITIDSSTNGYFNLTLYLINSSRSANISVYVVDSIMQPVTGYQVKALKYYLVNNSYIIQEIGITDVSGRVLMTLSQGDEYYKFIVANSLGEIVKVTDPAYIVTDTITIPISTEESPSGVHYDYDNIGSQLVFNTDTANFRLDFSTTNNLPQTVMLAVYENDNLTFTIYNTSTLQTSSGTIILGVDPINGTTYSAFAYFYDTNYGVYRFLTSASYTYPDQVSPAGRTGILAQVLLTLGVSSIAFINAPAAMILAPTSLVLGRYIGLNTLNWPVLITMMIVGMIFMFVLMKK